MIMGGEVYLPNYEKAWKIGRQLGLQVAAHMLSPFNIRPTLDLLAQNKGGDSGTLGLGPDNLFIHMTGMSDLGWQGVKDAGVQVSVAFPIEMNMRHGEPPILKLQSLGLEPSLSTDVEVTMTADLFTQMRSAMTMQRMRVNQMILEQGEFNLPLNGPRRPRTSPSCSTCATCCALPLSTARSTCDSTARWARSPRARKPTSSFSTPPRSMWRRSTMCPARWSR
jgi:hypothetical protein